MLVLLIFRQCKYFKLLYNSGYFLLFAKLKYVWCVLLLILLKIQIMSNGEDGTSPFGLNLCYLDTL